VILFPDQYFFLKEGKALVEGHKYSVILDFDSEKIFRLNQSGKEIISLGEKGSSLDECLNKLDSISKEELFSFLGEMSDKGLITFSDEFERVAREDGHPLELDTLWIETTSKCNLKCIHCYAEAKQYDQWELGKQKIFEIIDQAADLGFKKLQLTGGEPTLRPDISELVEYASSNKIDTIEVFTNGTLLTEELVKLFSDLGIHVAMSIYSHKRETHDGVTQVPGSLSRSLDSLKLLLAYDVPLRCAIVAMKQNEEDLQETSYFLSKLGVFNRPPDVIRPVGRGINPEYFPEKYGLLSIRQEPMFPVNQENFRKYMGWNGCWAGKAAITSKGDVLPCVFARDQKAGNVNENSLTEIIEEGLMGYWQMTRDEVDVCRDCEYRYLCQDCRPWAYGFTGSLKAKSPRCLYNPLTGEWEEINQLTETIKEQRFLT
jgi:radical SAM protein with 4Fe4S-binding SPASM domain